MFSLKCFMSRKSSLMLLICETFHSWICPYRNVRWFFVSVFQRRTASLKSWLEKVSKMWRFSATGRNTGTWYSHQRSMVNFGRFGWAEWQRNISDHVAQIGPLSKSLIFPMCVESFFENLDSMKIWTPNWEVLVFHTFCVPIFYPLRRPPGRNSEVCARHRHRGHPKHRKGLPLKVWDNFMLGCLGSWAQNFFEIKIMTNPSLHSQCDQFLWARIFGQTMSHWSRKSKAKTFHCRCSHQWSIITFFQNLNKLLPPKNKNVKVNSQHCDT